MKSPQARSLLGSVALLWLAAASCTTDLVVEGERAKAGRGGKAASNAGSGGAPAGGTEQGGASGTQPVAGSGMRPADGGAGPVDEGAAGDGGAAGDAAGQGGGGVPPSSVAGRAGSSVVAGAGGSKAGSSSTGGKAGASAASGAGGTAGGAAGGRPHSTNRDEFFGAARCPAGLTLCEDFEADALDVTTWEVQGDPPVMDATRAARGMRSAHFHTEGNGLSLIRQTKTFPLANNRYFGRLFVYFDTLPTAPLQAHWSILGAEGSGTEAEIRVGGQTHGAQNYFGVGTDRGESGDWIRIDDDPNGAPRAVPVDTWVCIEWEHAGDTNQTRFWWDGVEHPSLATTATEHGGTGMYVLPEFESVWVGWWLYQADPTPASFDVWIDSVAIDDERIGCSF